MSQPRPKRKKLVPTTVGNRSSASKAAPEEPKPENPGAMTVDVEVVDVTVVEEAVEVASELTQEEQNLRNSLERKVESAFYEAGKALMELRDRKLYRSTHKTFESYCKDRFGYNRRQPYLLMNAAVVFDNLKGKCDPVDRILPTNERQVRPLIKLKPTQQQKVWLKAVKEAGGKVPTGRIVQNIVDEMRDRTSEPNPYRVGEICVIQPKDNPDLKGKSGYWGVITHVGQYSCTVKWWDGDYTAKVEHLRSLEMLEEDYVYMQQLCERVRRLHEVEERDEAVDWLLQGLGKQTKPYLSAVQAKLLAAMEREYGIDPKQRR